LGSLISWFRRRGAVLLSRTFIFASVAILYLSLVNQRFILLSLANNKDALEAASYVTTIFGILVALGMSYIRFFSGRSFARRANVRASSSLFKAEGRVFSSLLVEVINIGSLPLYDIEINASMYEYYLDGSHKIFSVTNWLDNYALALNNQSNIIDPSETDMFCAVRVLREDVVACLYNVAARDKQGNVWKAFRFVSVTDAVDVGFE
jgi:hypothetical protein